MKQRTGEWFAARLGCVTASRVADVVAVTKNGPSERRTKYLHQLVAERLTGMPTSTYVTADMQRGIDLEATARTLFELKCGAFVEECGFVRHPRIKMSGASPDGRVADGLIEIKCPRAETHIETMLSGKIPAQYVPQMVWQMACTNALLNWFVSYNADMPEPQQLVCIALHRDDARIAEMETAVEAFLAEVADAERRAREYGRAQLEVMK